MKDSLLRKSIPVQKKPTKTLPPPKLENIGFEKGFLELANENSDKEDNEKTKDEFDEWNQIDLGKLTEIDFTQEPLVVPPKLPSVDFLLDDINQQSGTDLIKKEENQSYQNTSNQHFDWNQVGNPQEANSSKNLLSTKLQPQMKVIESDDFLNF